MPVTVRLYVPCVGKVRSRRRQIRGGLRCFLPSPVRSGGGHRRMEVHRGASPDATLLDEVNRHGGTRGDATVRSGN